MAEDAFVLEDYDNVPVKAPGLTKDQLKEWPPFKVSWRNMAHHRPTPPPDSRSPWLARLSN
jgi:hypothetical protein